MSIFTKDQLQDIAETYSQYDRDDLVEFNISFSKDDFANAMLKALSDPQTGSMDSIQEGLKELIRKGLFENPVFVHRSNPRKDSLSGTFTFYDFDRKPFDKPFDKETLLRYLDDTESYTEEWLARLNLSDLKQAYANGCVMKADTGYNVPVLEILYALENENLTEEQLTAIEQDLFVKADMDEKDIQSWKEYLIDEIEEDMDDVEKAER